MPRQFRAGTLQFLAMCHGQTAKNCASGRCELNPHLALVFLARTSRDSACHFQTVHQFDCAVMLNEEPRRQLTNGWTRAFRQSLHGQQQLVLLRLDAEFFRRRLAEMKELADLPPEFSQIAVLVRG